MVQGKREDITKFVLTATFLVAFAVMFVPFMGEVLLAAVFAFAVEPGIGRFLRAKHFRWRPSVAIILAGMFCMVAIPLGIVLYKLAANVIAISKAGVQNTELFKKIVVLRTGLLSWAESALRTMRLNEDVDLTTFSDDGLVRIANFVMGALTNLASNLPSILLSIFVFCAALYYFMADSGILKRLVLSWRLLPQDRAMAFIRALQQASYYTVVTSIIIGFVQATTVSVGVSLISGGDFFVVFVVTFFCSFIPVIGAAPVALVFALYDFVVGAYGQGIGLSVVAFFAGSIDNLLRPYLISHSEEGLHPVVSLLAIIGALIVFGMPCLFLGPVIASVAIKIVPLLYAVKDSSAERIHASE